MTEKQLRFEIHKQEKQIYDLYALIDTLQANLRTATNYLSEEDKEKVVKWMIDFGGWEEDEISDLYPELFESTEEVNINLEKLVENCAARLPLGLQKAIFSNNGHKKLHKECDKCGFLMPKYAGRYPNYCAMCGDPVDDKDKEVVAEAKSIDPNKDDILFDVAEEVYSKLDYKDLQNGTKVKSMLKKLGYGTDAITVTRVMNKIKENM